MDEALRLLLQSLISAAIGISAVATAYYAAKRAKKLGVGQAQSAYNFELLNTLKLHESRIALLESEKADALAEASRVRQENSELRREVAGLQRKVEDLRERIVDLTRPRPRRRSADDT